MSYIEFANLGFYIERYDELRKVESERGAAVIATIFIDELIEDVAGEYDTTPLALPPQTAKKGDAGWTIKPIDRLRRQMLVSDMEAQQLQLVREVRNVFAHTLGAASFSFPEIAALLKNYPEAPRDAFQSLFNTCAGALYSRLHAKYEERRKAYWAQKTPRITAAMILSRIDSGEVHASFESTDADGVSTYTTDDGAMFRVRVSDGRVAGVVAFWLGEWIDVMPGSSSDDDGLAAYESSAFPPPK